MNRRSFLRIAIALPLLPKAILKEWLAPRNSWHHAHSVFGADCTRIVVEDAVAGAYWDTALTDKEIAALAQGWPPYLVRPENLVSYCPPDLFLEAMDDNSQ